MSVPAPSIGRRLVNRVRAILRRLGIDVVRLPTHDRRYFAPSRDDSRPLPEGAAAVLRGDNPRLVELRQRYAQLDLPMATRTMWRDDYLAREVDLTRFRGDNAYVWQFRNLGAGAREKYYFYLRDVAGRDHLGLLKTLAEDGLFGCWAFEYPGWPVVSRDLLDSINELYFLDRHLQLLRRPGMNVLDIGAGYGRLAHRALAAAPALGRYVCVDGVPESTFLCEYYLGLRGCLDRAEVVPLDEFDRRLAAHRFDVAVNVHSFSEMSFAAIDGWISRIAVRDVPWLLVVPNDGGRFLTMEPDGSRREFGPVLTAHGYELAVEEPVFPDPTFRAFMGVTDRFFLFRRGAT